ncbi:MAG: preprotein translocase subunit SecE [Clostridiales bacterium]|jgi:preprotein translocase subunit SecE|nr:preprotein translocase subunit SecE [Clostridiales bacterium]
MAEEGNKASPGKGDKPDAKKGGSEQASKLSRWFKLKYAEYSAEFKRIIWPSRDDLLKQTLTVIVISLIFSAYIAILDGSFGFLFSQFAQIFSVSA